MIVMALRIDGNQRYSWMKQTIAVGELDAAAHLALQHGQLVSERGILCFKSALGLEERGDQVKKRNISATIVADVK
jgi:hypothetical protein